MNEGEKHCQKRVILTETPGTLSKNTGPAYKAQTKGGSGADGGCMACEHVCVYTCVYVYLLFSLQRN